MRNLTNFRFKKPEGRGHSEHLGVNGKVTLECILGKWAGNVDWMLLDQDRDQWWLVNTVMKLRVP
jgi:hypothetical protein